jgi:transposase-like protein
MADSSVKEKAVQMYGEGHSAGDVAAALGIGKTTVYRWCHAAGCNRTKSETQGCADDVKSRAIEMYKIGMHSTQVAKQLGIGTTAVLRWCRAAGCIRTGSEARRKDGYITGQGYRAMKRNGQTIFQHRLIAESVLRRPMSQLEVVHHVDSRRANNRPDNLWVFPSSSDHTRYHATGIIHPATIRLSDLVMVGANTETHTEVE